MQGAEERRLRRMSNTPQGGTTEGNAADDILMVDQGKDILCFGHRRIIYPRVFQKANLSARDIYGAIYTLFT